MDPIDESFTMLVVVFAYVRFLYYEFYGARDCAICFEIVFFVTHFHMKVWTLFIVETHYAIQWHGRDYYMETCNTGCCWRWKKIENNRNGKNPISPLQTNAIWYLAVRLNFFWSDWHGQIQLDRNWFILDFVWFSNVLSVYLEWFLHINGFIVKTKFSIFDRAGYSISFSIRFGDATANGSQFLCINDALHQHINIQTGNFVAVDSMFDYKAGYTCLSRALTYWNMPFDV